MLRLLLVVAMILQATSRSEAQSVTPVSEQIGVVADPEIQFLDLVEGRAAIIDESSQPYITGATDNFLRFCMGLRVEDPIPQDRDARRKLAESKFQETVRTFGEDEQALLRRVVEKLSRLTADDWPLISRVPWRFLKVDSSFCRGFAHTRGPNIVLSPVMMRVVGSSEEFAITLLLHEKLHVLQRLDPSRFDGLYQTYGFRKIKLAEGETDRLDVAQNPDAFELNWGIRLGGETSMLVPTFRKLTDGQLGFDNQRHALIEQADGTFSIGEVLEDSKAFKDWQSGYGLEIGLEHPNEVSAYLSTPLLTIDYLDQPQPELPEARRERIDQTRAAFAEILRESN